MKLQVAADCEARKSEPIRGGLQSHPPGIGDVFRKFCPVEVLKINLQELGVFLLLTVKRVDLSGRVA